MARSRGGKQVYTPCYVCGLPQPDKKYHEFPWHLTCAYDEAGRKKIVVYMREQKKLAKAEIPTLV